MSNIKFPNCQQFKFSKNSGRTEYGVFFIFLFPIVLILLPGISEFYGGSTGNIGSAIIVSILFGIILLISKIFFPSKIETHSCSNCKSEEKYTKNSDS